MSICYFQSILLCRFSADGNVLILRHSLIGEEHIGAEPVGAAYFGKTIDIICHRINKHVLTFRYRLNHFRFRPRSGQNRNRLNKHSYTPVHPAVIAAVINRCKYSLIRACTYFKRKTYSCSKEGIETLTVFVAEGADLFGRNLPGHRTTSGTVSASGITSISGITSAAGITSTSTSTSARNILLRRKRNLLSAAENALMPLPGFFQ